MTFTIIGSLGEDNKSKFEMLCKEIALVLIDMEATLLICSMFEDSADYYVLEEFVKKSSKAELYFWDCVDVRTQIEKVIDKNWNIKLIPCLGDNSGLDMKDAYLFCQINAIRQADVIIAIGGKNHGSASLLLHIAELNRKLVIPFTKYHGAAENYYSRNKYKIQDFLGDKYKILFTGTVSEIIKSFLEIKERQNIKKEDISYVFLSYARDNPTWADYVEVVLRRRGVPLFRDESEFKAGSDIPKIIQEEIFKADTFIAVWCREYACSPWCIDELELALERKDKINLWIICVDNTRIVPKGARNLLNYPVKNREELEGVLLKLLSP